MSGTARWGVCHDHGSGGGICQSRGGSNLCRDGPGCSRHSLGFGIDWVGCRHNMMAGEQVGGGVGVCQGVG